MARKLNLVANVPKVNFSSYFQIIRGEPKVGKTTLFRDLMKEEYGEYSAGVLLALGSESGATAISGIVTLECASWKALEDTVRELIKNRNEYSEVKVIGLDTIDEMNDMAEREVIAEHKRRNKGYAPKNYQSALGGYKAPNQYKTQIIKNLLVSLRRAGYGLIAIGHTKEMQVDEKHDGQVTGDTYSRLVSNLSHKDGEVFTNMADVIATIFVERYIDVEKYNKKSTATSRRFIYFRDNNFVEAGSRFPKIAEKVEWVGINGAPAYIATFRAGVLNSAGVTAEEMKALQQSESTDTAEDAKSHIAVAKRDSMMKLVVELGGRKDPEVYEILLKYVAKGDIREMQDESKFTELENELDVLAESRASEGVK